MKNNNVKFHNFLKHQKIMNVKLIKEQFPQIQNINFNFIFRDSDTNEELKLQDYNKNPDMKSLFDYDCISRECVKGGYDFEKEIIKAVQQNEKIIIGQLICNGWQDRERIGKHKCLMVLDYIIKIDYIQ